MLRVLIFAREQHPTDRADLDVLFAKELSSRGHCIDFVMQAARADVRIGPQPWRGTTVWVGRTDTGNGFVHRLRKHLLAIGHDLASLTLIRAERYDSVQFKDKYLVAALAVRLARRRGVRFYYWLSWPEAESQLLRARERSARYPFLAWIRGRIYALLLYHWILPRSDHVFVQSEQMKKDVCARGVPPEKVTPVPMACDLSELPAADAIAPGRSAGVTIGYLGVLSAERRLGILVEVLAALRGTGMDARLLIVGDAEQRSERLAIERRAQQLGVAEFVTITGLLPRQQALAAISTVDVALSPFYPTPILLSTSPTKLIEYLALGIPVVANDHPEQRLVLQQSRAGLCVPWGSRHFARAVRWLLRYPRAQRVEMGRRGRAWVENHRTYHQIASQLEAKYLQLLANGHD